MLSRSGLLYQLFHWMCPFLEMCASDKVGKWLLPAPTSVAGWERWSPSSLCRGASTGHDTQWQTRSPQAERGFRSPTETHQQQLCLVFPPPSQQGGTARGRTPQSRGLVDLGGHSVFLPSLLPSEHAGSKAGDVRWNQNTGPTIQPHCNSTAVFARQNVPVLYCMNNA